MLCRDSPGKKALALSAIESDAVIVVLLFLELVHEIITIMTETAHNFLYIFCYLSNSPRFVSTPQVFGTFKRKLIVSFLRNFYKYR